VPIRREGEDGDRRGRLPSGRRGRVRQPLATSASGLPRDCEPEKLEHRLRTRLPGALPFGRVGRRAYAVSCRFSGSRPARPRWAAVASGTEYMPLLSRVARPCIIDLRAGAFAPHSTRAGSLSGGRSLPRRVRHFLFTAATNENAPPNIRAGRYCARGVCEDTFGS
jgi:hypothetical protein